MSVRDEIKVTPEYWHNQYELDSAYRYSYVKPDGTLWNVKGVDDAVHLWTINAWGVTYYEHVNVHEFRETWRERKSA